MNVHHLELFFYVAKHGGISAAVQRMPYGIQQPAVSGQILQLEQFLGQKLFQRRPFALTPSGERLFRFIQPFFENLGDISDELRGLGEKKLRLAASSALLRDYGPGLLNFLRTKIPDMKLVLREADQTLAEKYLLAQEVDLAITELYNRPPSSLRSETIAVLTPVLLAPRSLGPIKGEKLLQERSQPLISVPTNTALHRIFVEGLQKRGWQWEISIELSTLEMVQTYAAAGFGVGLSVLVPGVQVHPEVRVVPLKGFPSLRIGACWQEPLPPVPALFLGQIRAEAAKLIAAST